MTPAIGLGIAQAGLSVLGGIAQNKAITKAATQSYEANKLFIERDSEVLNQSLLYAGEEVKNQTGMALTDLLYAADRVFATQEATRAETQIYGNTAARQQAVANVREELAKDKIVQEGEANLLNINNKLREAKYQTEAKHAQNIQNYNNAMSQRKSTFELLVGGASAALSGYSTGLSMETASDALTLQKAQLKALGV